MKPTNTFSIQYTCEQITPSDYLVIYANARQMILPRITDKVLLTFGEWVEILPLLGQFSSVLAMIGNWENRGVYAIRLDGARIYGLSDDLIVARDIRTILQKTGNQYFNLITRGLHISTWHNQTSFCSVCGSLVDWKADECAKQCNRCNAVFYPKINPAIIVGITKGSSILLAKTKQSASPWFSLIAGYVEAGESFEETVYREVKEECGISIKNLRYFKSQPWAFSQSAMVAYTAEWESGEIVIDTNELIQAGWYDMEDLPDTPPPPSIGWALVEELKKIKRIL